MAYPKRLLQDDEQLSLDLQPHWWFFAKQIAASIPLVALIIFLLTLDAKGNGRKYGLWVWAIAMVVFAVWVVVKFLDWRFTHFVLTNERVIFRTGVLSKRGVEIPLGRINNINFNQGIWERIIGAGDLSIESAGRDGQSLFSNVQHPDGVQQEIYRMMEEFDRRRASWAQPQPNAAVPTNGSTNSGTPGPAGGAPASPGVSIPDQIAQLAILRDRGALTDAEFEAKKRELLNRM